MNTPQFYQPERVGQLFKPDTATAIGSGQALNLPPASKDKHRNLLILVDAQIDFVHTDGSLSVPGAVEDTRRLMEWLFRNVEHITSIAASLDSHVPNQIFYPTWWLDKNGNPPEPFTPISAEQVEAGEWQPRYKVDWSKSYVKKLEEQAKKVLMIWPYHTMIGSPGHNITPALYEAIAYHAAARQSQPEYIIKGTIPETEHYSLLEPEVKLEDDPRSKLNTDFLERAADYDAIYVSGQAKSHCVLETMSSIMHYFKDRPDVIKKIHLITDTTSSVAHPEIDFDAMANEVLDDFAQHGMQTTLSTESIG